MITNAELEFEYVENESDPQFNIDLFNKLTFNKDYKIFALTNWSAEKWPMALELFPFFNNFIIHH